MTAGLGLRGGRIAPGQGVLVGVLNKPLEDSDRGAPIKLPVLECRLCWEIGGVDGQQC